MEDWKLSGYLILSLRQDQGAELLVDDQLQLVAKDKKPSLTRLDGVALLDGEDIGHNGKAITVFQALVKLVTSKHIIAKGVVLAIDGENVRCRVDVHFHNSVWRGLSSWKDCSAAALLFSRLRPLSEVCTVECEPDTANGADYAALCDKEKPFSMASCFSELRSPFSDPKLPSVPMPNHQGGFTVAHLSADILQEVVRHLDARDTCALSCTCRLFHAICSEAAPFLRLSLYPHQRAALRWMLEREKEASLMPHPTWRFFQTKDGLPLWGCAATGNIRTDEPPSVTDIRGGFFCDEPGLGKTITALALVLRTKDSIPRPPPEAKVTVARYKDGKRAAFYTMPAHAKVRASSAGSVRRSRRGSDVGGQHDSLQPTPRVATCAAPLAVQAGGFSCCAPKARSTREKRSSSEQPALSVEGGEICNVGGEAAGYWKRQKMSDSSAGGQQAQPEYTYQHRLLQAGEHGEEGLEDETDWVQCDICDKWRALPIGHKGAHDGEWICIMHPDPEMASCNVEEEKVHEDTQYTYCEGYVKAGAAQGQQKNVDYFQRLAHKHLEVKHHRHVLPWLVKESHDQEKLLRGIKIPPRKWETGVAERVANMLEELGFLASEAGKPRAPPKGKATRKRHSTAQVLWQRPHCLGLLRLDRAALKFVADRSAAGKKASVPAGSLLEQRCIYVSSATLLVVPSTLIQHWIDQINMHTVTGTVRVRVLDSRGDAEPLNALDIAWHYDIVITTFQRLSNEGSLGKQSSASVLKQIHWLRIILDEGHTLGANLTITNKLLMAISLRAERRWVMTGTPTPNTPTSHVAHLQPLLAFLGHDPYGTQRNMWLHAVERPFEAHQADGRSRLVDLLKQTTIRASKDDLITLTKCFRKVTVLEFAPEHALSSNELVEVVKKNILLGDWGDEDHKESLLSSKWGHEMLKNVRMSCCVAGNCNLDIKEEDLKETLELLAERLGHFTVDAVEPPWVDADHPLSHIEEALRHGTTCQLCSTFARMPLVTPCAHLVCVDCAAPHRTECPVCKEPYRMQSVEDPERLVNNPHPKWEVPIEVIEWQPSYTQQGALGISGGQWNADWENTNSSKCMHLLQRLVSIGAAPHLNPMSNGRVGMSPEGAKPTKAIVFTQFWHHLHLIEKQLMDHGIGMAVFKRTMKSDEKARTLDQFKQTQGNTAVLLMDETGSVGLDLSFVPWVFLMEPLVDASLEQQVVARAHRMGAKSIVQVETLVMRGTVEQKIIELTGSAAAAFTTEERDALSQDVEEGRLTDVQSGGGSIAQRATESLIALPGWARAAAKRQA
ncbi:g11264 [Coccomyxa elongata]